MRLILLGPPGVGKGTQGARLSQALGVPSVSTGALLRTLIASGDDTPLVRAARRILGGEFVSDAFANQLAFSAIEREAGFVLDGYPRSVAQAEALECFLTERGHVLDRVLFFLLGDDALEARVLGRRVCIACGATYHLIIAPPRLEGACDACGSALGWRVEDDAPQKRALRRQLYQTQTAPLCAFYQERGLLSEIDAEGDPESIFKKVCESLSSLI